ncbi:MAG: hypothetical protein QOG15_3663 [Solirubrobacteraceae bacterium]|jgi:hypothetical protein|nr:hypothetical protein [Solirubrobacteraceae bacterium]
MSKIGDALRAPFLKRFGGKGARDRAQLRAWLTEVGDFNPTYARILEAFGSGNVGGARAEIDQLIASVTRAQEKLPQFDSPDLQTVTQDYSSALVGLARSADRVLSLDENAERAEGPADRSEAEAALGEFRQRGVEARAAGRELLTRLTADLTAAQRQQVDALSRKQQQGNGG